MKKSRSNNSTNHTQHAANNTTHAKTRRQHARILARFKKFGIKDKDYCKAVVLCENGSPANLPTRIKVESVAKMVAGSAITIAGVPLMAVPLVGSAAVLTGASLALGGQRTLSGREATNAEVAIERAGNAIKETVKDTAADKASQAAKAAHAASKKVAMHMPAPAHHAVTKTKNVVLSAKETLPAHASSAAKTAREAAAVVREAGPAAVAGAAAGAGAVAGVTASIVYKGVKVASKRK